MALPLLPPSVARIVHVAVVDEADRHGKSCRAAATEGRDGVTTKVLVDDGERGALLYVGNRDMVTCKSRAVESIDMIVCLPCDIYSSTMIVIPHLLVPAVNLSVHTSTDSYP